MARHRHIAVRFLSGLALLAAPFAPADAWAGGRILGADGGLFSKSLFEIRPDDGAETDLIERISKAADKETHKFSFVKAEAVWLTRIVYVCWENLDDSTEDRRNLVRRSVEDTWMKESALSVRGWGECVEESTGIRIAVKDDPLEGPHVKALGNFVDGVREGMVLNLTFRNWSLSCQDMVEACIHTITVHEFGHAIGFAHEQNRSDTPDDCAQPAQGENGDTMDLTPWDKDSVMNYCAEGYMADGKLSELDIKTVRILYGEPS